MRKRWGGEQYILMKKLSSKPFECSHFPFSIPPALSSPLNFTGKTNIKTLGIHFNSIRNIIEAGKLPWMSANAADKRLWDNMNFINISFCVSLVCFVYERAKRMKGSWMQHTHSYTLSLSLSISLCISFNYRCWLIKTNVIGFDFLCLILG